MQTTNEVTVTWPVIESKKPKERLVSIWKIAKVEGFGYMASRWEISTSAQHLTEDVFTAPTLHEIRRNMPDGLVNLGRKPEDDTNLIETWI